MSQSVAGAPVDKNGDQDLVRKVCVNSKKFGDQKGSFNAYIVFNKLGLFHFSHKMSVIILKTYDFYVKIMFKYINSL